MTPELQKKFYLKIGKRLTALRKQRNLTIAELARKVDQQYKTIAAIEAGRPCGLHHSTWMLKHLGLNLNEIIQDMEDCNGKEGNKALEIDDFI